MMVEQREYARLLGYPWGAQLEGDILLQAMKAADWYDRYGRPRVYCVSNITGITAGHEVDREVERLWQSDRVDEAYFLDRYAAAVVEKFAAEQGELASPGNGSMPFDLQWELFAQLAPLNPAIEILPSGMLRPKNSLLAIVRRRGVQPGNPCRRCSFMTCSFRRKSV